MDISERKEQESQLWQANRHVPNWQSPPPMVLCMNGTPGTRKAVSSAGLHQVLGYHPEELDNDIDAWSTLIHPDDFDDVSSQGFAAMDLSGQYALEYRLRHHAGHYIHVLDRESPNAATTGSGCALPASRRTSANASKRKRSCGAMPNDSAA